MNNTQIKKKILIVLHKGQKCGVHDYGEKITRLIQNSSRYIVEKIDATSIEEVISHASRIDANIILYNYHSDVMPWINCELKKFKQYIHIAIQHEIAQENIHEFNSDIFDYHLSLDPTLVAYNPIISTVPRILEPYNSIKRSFDDKKVVIGSFGFLTKNKRFDKIVDYVNDQFDEALIRFNISPHDSLDKNNERFDEQYKIWNKKITKEKISLSVTNEHFNHQNIFKFLSENSLNFFYYENDPGRGIASVTDFALSVDVPIAINNSSMFRHILHCNPSPCIENSSLTTIIENGTKGLDNIKKLYQPDAALSGWEKGIDEALLYIEQKYITPDNKGFNKILDDTSREKYTKYIQTIEKLCPVTIKNKIPRANIQQAFVLHAVQHFSTKFISPEILAVGSFEDTASQALIACGYKVIEIDPNVNMDLQDFYLSNNTGSDRYEIIICTSVLEHIKDDEYFISMIADLLAPNGYGIFTVDFKEDYKDGDNKPTVDHRLYTSHDLIDRLIKTIPECRLIDEPQWNYCEPDFEYEDCNYNFATIVFKKFDKPLKLHFCDTISSNSRQAWKHYGLYSNNGWNIKNQQDYFNEYDRKYITINDIVRENWKAGKNNEKLSLTELKTDIFEKKMQERDRLIRHLRTQNRMLRIAILGFRYFRKLYLFFSKRKN